MGINYHPKVVAIDSLPQLIGLYDHWRNDPLALYLLEETVATFGLSKKNRRGYYLLRDAYNLSPNPVYLYALIAHSFNHQIRFNSGGEFNMPFGLERSQLNKKLKEHLKLFISKLQDKDIEFRCCDFEALNCLPLFLVYCDPPYRITLATYNERGWQEIDDLRLLNFLDSLHNRSIKFGLSNVVRQGEKVNSILADWCSKYTVHRLEINYSNCSYHKKERADCEEVYVTNFTF